MTSDNAPALGGQSNDGSSGDASPMISSVQTRVIADARGAYLARNLDALIKHLSPTQQITFKQAVVRQCVHLLEQRLPADEPNDQGQYEGVRFGRQWLANPDSVDIQAGMTMAVAEAIDGGVRYHDYHEIFLQPIYVICSTDLLYAAREAVRTASVTAFWEPRGADVYQSAEAAYRWQIEAAWAILRNQPVPPLDTHT
jgi:hypothetical protein